MAFSINGSRASRLDATRGASLLTDKLLEGPKNQDDKSVFPRIFRSDRHFAFTEHQIPFPEGFFLIAHGKGSLSFDSVEDQPLRRHVLVCARHPHTPCAD